MPEIISMGEALVEIMREKIGAGLDRPEVFVGPFPSGAPAIFADCAARLGGKVGYIGTVGNDDFGKVIRDRLLEDGVDLTYFQSRPDATTGVAFVAYFADGSRKFLYHIRNAASGCVDTERIVDSYFQGARFLHINGSAVSINEDWKKTIYKAVDMPGRSLPGSFGSGSRNGYPQTRSGGKYRLHQNLPSRSPGLPGERNRSHRCWRLL
ncbi:MAG: PfkB family carbohydrate kinase [Candidatus Atribacteria bacterium]|nr:PfkB family carbohydrate kinase [Candidatus Atribacteria bacterium]